MAKGRKFTASRSERLLGTSGYNNQGQGTMNGGTTELGEDEVWSMVDGGDDDDEWSSRASTESSGSFIHHRSNRQAPPSNHHRQVGGLSLAFDDSSSTSTERGVMRHFHTTQDRVADSPRGRSAPMNVPDWSKIYRVDSVESFHEWGDDDDNDSEELVPPHEYLAREYARKVASNSVFEGVGRTLKGRDLSRVRDAVWSQTGFDG